MKQPIQITRSGNIRALRKTIKKSKDEKQKVRIRAIIRIKRGENRLELAEDIGISDRTLYNWVRMYNEGGSAALKMKQAGRPEGNPKWDTDIFDALITHIESHPGYWSIPKMRIWVEKKYKKEIPDVTIWYHLKQRKYSYKSGRPHPYKGDRKAQEVFKKKG